MNKPLTAPESLRTERLLLRRWKDSDLKPFADMCADPEVMRYFPNPLSFEETKLSFGRIQQRFEQYGFGLWAVELLATQEFLGFIGLAVPTFEAHFTPCVEIGWRLRKEHWGKGLAPEGALAVLRDGFERVGLEEIISMTATTNLPSMRVMEKIGMHRDPNGDFDHPMLVEGHHLRRHVLYRLKKPV